MGCPRGWSGVVHLFFSSACSDIYERGQQLISACSLHSGTRMLEGEPTQERPGAQAAVPTCIFTETLNLQP